MKTIAIKITSAVVIDGVIARVGDIVTVSETVARDILGREKAVLATADDEPQSVAADDEQPDESAGQADTGKSRKRK